MNMEKHAARRRAVVDAGFLEARRNDVLEKIESAFEVHEAMASAGGAIAEARGKLEKIAQAAEKLRALIDELPAGARTHLGFAPKHYKLAGQDPLAVLIERARSYQASVQRGSGKPKNSNLRGLLEELATLWENELPNGAGITRDGSGPDEGRALYKGPLFDFVRSLLDAEGIEYRSVQALGRQLWELWIERRRKDDLHAAGQCVSCAKELQDKARWQCDDCRGWLWPQATVQKPS